MKLASVELIYKRAKNHLKHLINTKKKNYMRTKLSMNIGKPKELWKALKSLGLPSKAKKESKYVFKMVKLYPLMLKKMLKHLRIISPV